MQFCCNLKGKGKYIAILLRSLVSLFLVITLCCIAVFQYHHHCSSAHHDECVTKTVIKKSEHCKICDHFLHHKSNAIKPDHTAPDLSIAVPPTVKGGVHILGDYTCIVQIFSNKGPPSWS
jgi:hypothetical protein